MSTSPAEQVTAAGGRVDGQGPPPGLGGLALPSRIKIQEYALVGVVLALIVIGAILKPDTFPTADNFRAILTQASVVGVLAIGMTFVIATAGIDLSVGSVVAAAGVAGGLIVDSGTAAFVGGAIGFGLGLGLVNATAIAYGKVVPFVATLAMLAIARGLALLMSDKSPISLLGFDGVRWFGTGEIVGIPVSIVFFVGIAIGGWVLLNRTRYGRHVVAVGGNREAARIAGVPVRRVVFSVYCLSGLLAGLAAVLLSGRLASASPVAGELLELDAIGAAVIGGTSLAGGRATITGTFLGVMVFAIMFNLLTQLNLATEWQQIVKGAIILAAVLIQRPERI
jgi:ribose transport system permease protein